MSTLPDLLIESALKPRVRALRENGFAHEAKMLDEALAVMIEIAEHPQRLQNAALLIIPDIAREQLAAYRLIELTGRQGTRWRLTARGSEMAGVLHAAAPAEDPTELAREAAALERELRQDDADLGVDDGG